MQSCFLALKKQAKMYNIVNMCCKYFAVFVAHVDMCFCWISNKMNCFLAGKNRATLLDIYVLQPVGLVVYGNYVYWIDRQTRNVMKIKKEGEILGSTVQAAIDDLSDMIIVDTKTTGRVTALLLLPFASAIK